MSIDVSSKDVYLLATGLVVQQRIVIVFPKSQWLSADDTHTVVCITVKHVGIILNQIDLILWFIETAGIVDPPVRLVLNRYGVNINTMVMHPLQEGVEPREELVVAVLAQLTFLIALVFSITTLGSAIGLVFTRRRPRRTENDTTTLFTNLSRRQRTIPVVVAPVVASETW